MKKAVWTGAIAFGLVHIPVKLYSAIGERNLDFDMLDQKDFSRIKYKRVNEKTGKEVPWAQIVKGYELNGKYVVLTDDDFEKASPEKTKLIQMDAFVKPTEIDIILYDNAYYLGPAKGGERVFALFEQALRKSGKAGVGSFVMRNKEKPVSVRSADGVVILHTLRFLSEIKDPTGFSVNGSAQKTVKPKEITMAVSLIKNLETSFDIGVYKDTYSQKLIKFIKAKASGKKLPTVKQVEAPVSNDIMEQLKQSLGMKKAIPRATKKNKSKD
jgi:DNA end-binding protein Ku